MVLAQGSLELQEYEGKDGKNHVSVSLIANKVVSLSKKENGASAPASTTQAAARRGCSGV